MEKLADEISLQLHQHQLTREEARKFVEILLNKFDKYWADALAEKLTSEKVAQKEITIFQKEDSGVGPILSNQLKNSNTLIILVMNK